MFVYIKERKKNGNLESDIMQTLTIVLFICVGYTFAGSIPASDEASLYEYLENHPDIIRNLESLTNAARGEVPDDAKLDVVCKISFFIACFPTKLLLFIARISTKVRISLRSTSRSHIRCLYS